MSDSSLVFRHLEIRRTPGFRSGGFTLDELSPGINLIFGPNGVGKTTTADALKMLLWPSLARESQAAVLGRLDIENTPWLVDVDIDRVQYQREGQESSAPTLPPGDLHDRYSLSLHSLIRANDREFAAHILQEMAGGFDLQKAAEILKPRTNPPLHRTELGKLESARSAYREAIAKKQELRAQEAELQDLGSEKKLAEDAVRRIHSVEAAIGLAEARAAELEAAEAVGAYPRWMKQLKGDEHESIETARSEQRRLQAEIQRLEESIREKRDQLTRASLPAGGLPEPLIPALRNACTELRDAERNVTELERELAGAAAVRDQERRSIGEDLDDALLARLDSKAIGTLAEFSRTAGETRAERAAREAAMRRLMDTDETADPEKLAEGIRCLRAWLRTPGSEQVDSNGLRRSAATIGWAMIALGIMLMTLFSISLILPLAGALVVVAAGFLLWRTRRVRPADTTDHRRTHEAEFARLGLPSPESWSADEVEALLESLLVRHGNARGNAYNAARREEILAQDADLTAREQEIERRRSELVTLYGVAPDTSAEHFHWLVERIDRWQDANSGVVAAEAGLQKAKTSVAKLRSDLMTRLAEFGYSGVDAEEEVAALEARNRTHLDAERDLASDERLAKQLREQLRGFESDCERIAERLGLTTADEATITDWCARYSEFTRAFEAHSRSEVAVRIAKDRLNATGVGADLSEAPIADLEIELGELRARAERLDEINRSITSVETLIREAKRSHDVEAALAEVDRCEAALADLREPALRSLIASDLVEYVESATRDRNLPDVFRRAREIFAGVTKGRYELSFGNGPEPSFRAIDTRTARGHALDELSSGTRVQLLISVRLAFVEAQETGTKLPLFLDETLANSDDERAIALIEAVMRLASEGRQIFYFTAQPDEVGKWRQMLQEQPDLPSRVQDLALIRNQENGSSSPRFNVGSYPVAQVPSPNGDGHGDYGDRLNVPAADPRGSASNLHLWYLVEDPQDLFSLLQLGIECWGDLKSYVEFGGKARIDPGMMARIAAAARVADEALSHARVGRGKPVDRLVLKESGAVSDVFIDRVAELCASRDGHARSLLEALDAREVRGFRATSIESLRDYLEAEGYLDPREPLAPGEIRLRAFGVAAPDVQAGLITDDQIDRLLIRLALT